MLVKLYGILRSPGWFNRVKGKTSTKTEAYSIFRKLFMNMKSSNRSSQELALFYKLCHPNDFNSSTPTNGFFIECWLKGLWRFSPARWSPPAATLLWSAGDFQAPPCGHRRFA